MTTGEEAAPLQRTEIDFIILADRAEVINGKLYMMGGGWDALVIPQFPAQVSFSIAIGILVPWAESNEVSEFMVTIHDGDGATLTSPFQGRFIPGRPPLSPKGQPLRTMLVVNQLVPVQHRGLYSVRIQLASGAVKQVGRSIRSASQPSAV
ncbi:MAG: hypothetical protein M1118_11005 [Chloroflexi bacterium]|nr:hypothetical protein [Chloroflexota bacterium]